MKKLIALLMASVLALSLAACSNSGNNNSQAPENNSQTPASQPADNSTAPSDEGTNSGAPVSEEPQGTKTFVFGSDANANTFDPATDLQTNSARALTNSVLETLWKVNNDGTVVDDLAASHEWTGQR